MSLMKKLYIILFTLLYSVTAFVSCLHAVEFFGLSNDSWIAIMLAICFELGQASVLLSILTSKQERSKFMPWTLMTLLTIVQIIGNVYSSYKYIVLNSAENLRFFKESIFIWTQLPDDQANVIITYIAGGILPIVALAMTAMITNYLNIDNQNSNEELETDSDKELKNYSDKELKNDSDKELKNDSSNELKNDLSDDLNENDLSNKLNENDSSDDLNEDSEKDLETNSDLISDEVEEIFNHNESNQKQSEKSSHFVNL